MYSFTNDYSEMCHPLILENISKCLNNQYGGYSSDSIFKALNQKIIKLLDNPESQIYLFSGGTQTNLVTIKSVLQPYQGVISADTGHISTHETGAIEACGHKILTIPSSDGKIYAQEVAKLCQSHFEDPNFEHTVQPGMVYISNPTEVGTIYKKSELEALIKVCHQYHIPLFLDGARLATALTSKENDIDFKDLAKLTDMFYIGGTKCGALFGECLVINSPKYQKNFRYIMKQKGALMAKGFVMATQFDTLFTDGLYFKIGQHENDLANYFSAQLQSHAVKMFQPQATNQIFPILTNSKINDLKTNFDFQIWEKISADTSAIRICISFMTTKSVVDQLIAAIIKE